MFVLSVSHLNFRGLLQVCCFALGRWRPKPCVVIPHCLVEVDDSLWKCSDQYPRERNGSPLQYSCLENPKDRGAGWASVHGVTKSQTRLCDYHFLTDMVVTCYMWLFKLIKIKWNTNVVLQLQGELYFNAQKETKIQKAIKARCIGQHC